MTSKPARVLIVGRSPGVLTAAVALLRAKGYHADATNQFDQVLDDYAVNELEVLVVGGMVPPDTRQWLCDEITRRNPGIRLVQGLAGIAGVIAAQVEAVTGEETSDGVEVTYDDTTRTFRATLPDTAWVTVDALWISSFTPPEPTSAALRIFGATLAAGSHDLDLPDRVPSEASYAVVTVGSQVRVLTVGPMPTAIRRLAPTSANDRRLPDVAALTTHGGRP